MDDTVLSKESCDSFLMSCMIEICQPQPEYYLDKNPQSLHPNSQKFKVQQLIQTFLDKSTPLFMDLFRIKCHNRSRQRRNLSKLVQEWESLQLDVFSIYSKLTLDRENRYGLAWIDTTKADCTRWGGRPEICVSVMFMGVPYEIQRCWKYSLHGIRIGAIPALRVCFDL